MIEFFTSSALSWTKFREIRKKLLQNFASLAGMTLGTMHPIARITTILAHAEPMWLEPLLRNYVEFLRHAATRLTDKEVCLRVQLSVAFMLLDFGEWDLASGLCQRLWKDIQPIASPPTLLQTQISTGMAFVSAERNDHLIAKNRLLQCINWSVKATGKQNGDWEGILACHSLGPLHWRMGRYPESEKYHRLALDGLLPLPDASAGDKLRYVNHVRWALEMQGKHAELDQFMCEYGSFGKEVDK